MASLVKVPSSEFVRRAEEAQTQIQEFLVFVLGQEEYGMELKHVREILSPPPMTVVPRAPSGVVGVCSVRGMLTTVFDLRRLIGLSQIGQTRRTRVLLVEIEGEAVGLLVDEVRNVLRLAGTEIERPEAGLTAEFGPHVVGIGRPGGGSVVLIDPTTLVGR